MRFIRLVIKILFSCYLVHGHAQPKFESLGDPTAIVLDMKIDEARKLIMASTTEHVQIWNYESKSLLKDWPVQNILAIDFENNSLAAVSKTGGLYIWDIINTGTAHAYTITSSPLLCLTWIDSVWIAVGSNDGLIYKVNSQTGEIKTSVKSKGSITAMASFGLNLIVGNSEGELEIYNADDFNFQKSIQAHASWIREIQVMDSTETFVTVSDDAMFKQWNSTLDNKYELKIGGDWLICVDYIMNKSAHTIMAIGKLDGKISIQGRFGGYSTKANASINKIAVLREAIPKIKIVSATHGGGIQIWDATKMKFNN